MSEPRYHHYTFAHHALRQVGLADPLRTLGVMASPDALRFISHLFSAVCDSQESSDVKPDFGPEEITIHPTRVGNHPCAIIEMPVPRFTAEAHMTALVYCMDLEEEIPEQTADIPARYFTLEKGYTADPAEPRTVFGEWSDEAHYNYGDGPDPEVEAFRQRIEEMLADQ